MLTKQEWGLLFQSLRYTKMAFEDYSDYPSYEFKCERINEVNNLVAKLRQLRRKLEKT